MSDSAVIVAGEFVLHDLFAEFTYQVNRKIESLLGESSVQDSRQIMKSLQRGEDAQFDQLLSALGCVAENCLPSLLETLFKWFDQHVPTGNIKSDGKSNRAVKSKSDTTVKEQDVKKELQEMVIAIVFCLVLIEVLQQLPVHPLPENQIQHILSLAFAHFRNAALVSAESTNSRARIVADLFAEVIGVTAKAKFQHVRSKFLMELEDAKKSENSTRIILGLIMGMKFFRVKMYPVEDFEASFRFLRELADYSLEVKDREIKHGLASLFVEILVPVAAAVKTEVNVPVLRDFVDALYPTSLEVSKRKKNQLAMYPLVTCLLCVSQKQFFLNNWHIFLDNCLSNLKNRDQKISRVALESLYRLLWAYTVRVKCESNTATQSRLQSVVKTLFPVGSRSIVPKDTPLSIYVKIIQFIAQERLDFAMKEIILDLLCINLSSSRNTKITTLQPERMNIGLRAFLVITDSLQQKDGAPPMPTTVGVMPSGNTLRVKKTFLNKMLTEDDARTIGVSQYHKHVQKALDGILVTLDGQVGQRMMMTNRTSDVIGVENKPKIDLFRTCIAAMPRLIPAGTMTQTELFELLSRLTIHIDEDLRSQAFTSLLSFAQDFLELREDVVAAFVSFILKQVTDIHHVLLDTALKHLMQLISGWRTNSAHYTDASFTSRSHIGKASDFHERRGAFTPLISHLEGFALVLLCSNRSATRKLACLLLKEIKTLARTLSHKMLDNELCIDVLDRLCPVVASEVIIDQELPHRLSTAECKAVLAIAEKQDVTALVECVSSCNPRDNVDLWTSFIASLMKPERVPAFCQSAISFSWPNVNIRLNQLWLHMDPIQTSSNKKQAATVPSSSDTLLSLWTNYTVFACRCAPTSASLLKKHSISAIPAGTPDWLVALSRDSERITATPSTLFQRLITLLRMENNAALRDSAASGLGSTSITAFPDLMVELQTVIHEASKSHRQDNMRRKRKRDNARVMLARVLERLARHKVLSQCAASDLQLPAIASLNRSKTPLSGILLEYIKDTCSFLDKVESLPNSSGFSQQPQQPLSSPFPGTLSSSGASLSAQPSAPNLMDDLRIHFGSMIIHLIRHLPEHSQCNFLPNETRRILFFLFGRWCGKYGDALEGLDTLDDIQNANISTLLHVTALKAECAVLCCGPVFDSSGLQSDTGYLYPWLEALLDYTNAKIHRYGRETIVLLLQHNRNTPALLSWLIDKCYTGSQLVSVGCFCSIATAFHYIDTNADMIALLNLALFNMANSEVSQTAQHLLMMIQARFMPAGKMDETSSEANNSIASCNSDPKDRSLRLNLDFPYERMYSPPLYRLSQFDISKDLARLHPEFTIPMLSEIFRRFMLTTTTVWQQLMLQYMLPWLQNVELTLHEAEGMISELNNCTKLYEFPLHMLHSYGWGSVEATLFVLNNLTYITIRYHAILGNEIEKCWSTLCYTWPENLDVLLLYTSALSACGGCDTITFVTKKLITFFGRAKSKEVAQYLVKECQNAHSPTFGVDILNHPPFLKIDIQDMIAFNRIKPFPTTSPPRSVTLKSKKKSSKSILSSSAPNSYMHINGAVSESPPPVLGPSLIRASQSSTQNQGSLSHGLPHHSSLQHLSTNKPASFDNATRRSLRPSSPVRSKMSTSMYSLPNLNADAGLSVSSKYASNMRIIQHETMGDSHLAARWSSVKEGRARAFSEKSNPSTKKVMSTDAKKAEHTFHSDPTSNDQVQIFLDWKDKVETGCPLALPLPTTPLYYLRLDEYFRTDVIQKSNGLLRSNIACILLSEIAIEHGVVIDWKSYLPTLLLSLVLGLDVEYENVPQKCQFLLAHIIIQLLSPKDQAIFSSSVILDSPDLFFDDVRFSLLHLKRGTTPSSIGTIDSGIESSSSPEVNESALLRFGTTSDHVIGQNVYDVQVISDYIRKLLQGSHGPLWLAEDVSPKCHILKSTEQLNEHVSTVVGIVGTLIPDYGLKKKLAKQALKFSFLTNNKHCACRALQVFRSLKLPLRPNNISELSLSLTECIADGSDLSSQSWAIEILLTLLQTCEISIANLSKTQSRYLSLLSKRSLVSKSLLKIGRSPRNMKRKSSPEPSGSSARSSPIPVSPKSEAVVPASSPSMTNKSKAGRRGHVHRRSGSVSISKQILEEAKCAEPELPPAYEATAVKTNETFSRVVSGNDMSLSKSPSHSNIPPASPYKRICMNLVDEWKNGLAQIFWIAVGILESDYEHEYLIALHIIQRVLQTLSLTDPDGRSRLERSFKQIQWCNFKGLQTLLLKGLTCNTTFETAFSILTNLMTVTHLPLVSSHQDGCGFAINVIALLPRLINHFGDPDPICCECAQNVTQICVEYFNDYIKLQSLAHVMSLYSNSTYNKSVQTWVNVVCKYVHETFPQALSSHLYFLAEMLEKGHPSFHLASLHIIASLLSFSSIITSETDDKLIHELLHVVSKHLGGKNWKEALNILKLAVSRSSQLASPTSDFIVTQGVDDKEKIELPGKTLSFKLDLSGTQLNGPRKSPNGKEVSSPVGTGWRRPHLSQRRTRERLRFVLNGCSTARKNEVFVPEPQRPPEPDPPSHLSEAVSDASSPDTDDKSCVDVNLMDEVQVHGVFRDFDFLDDETEETEGENDNFNTGMHWNTSSTNIALSSNIVEIIEVDEPPDEFDLTPVVTNIPEEDKEEDEYSDTVSLSSVASSVISNHESPPIAQSSNEYLTSEVDDNNQDNVSSAEQLNEKGLKIDSLAPFKPLPNTYIRAVSPSPPELSHNKVDERVFSTRRSVTEQLNEEQSETEGIYSDENISAEEPERTGRLQSAEVSNNTSAPPTATSRFTDEDDDPDEPSPSSLSSAESRSGSNQSLTLITKHDLFNITTWNEPSPLHGKNLRWKACLLSVAEDIDGSALSKFFTTFPSIYRSLCVDFSILSKDGCSHLGNQLSSISNHFSSMVDHLPKQLECPLCLGTEEIFVTLMEQKMKLKSYVADLEDQMDFYSSKQEDATECMEAVLLLDESSKGATGDSSSPSYSHQLEQKQLELCRLLYTLHFQLLLIFQNFNRLVRVLATSLPPDDNVPDQLTSLHKQLLLYEQSSSNNSSSDEIADLSVDLKSMTNEEGLSALFASMLEGKYKQAQMQLAALRNLWSMEPFGCTYDSGADFLTNIYYRRSTAKSNKSLYAILGENADSLDLCEKLMEVNMQIQHSLQLLEKPGTRNVDTNTTSTNDANTKSGTDAHNSRLAEELGNKRTSF